MQAFAAGNIACGLLGLSFQLHFNTLKLIHIVTLRFFVLNAFYIPNPYVHLLKFLQLSMFSQQIKSFILGEFLPQTTLNFVRTIVSKTTSYTY